MTDRIATFASKYGVPAAIALFLVGWLVTELSGRLTTLDARALAIDKALTNHSNETNWLLRGICLNTADTEAERANCILR